jgi:hypothetical protein
VVLGSAFDILQRGWPPRTAYVDYPLGYSCGKPFDAADQRAIAASALSMLHEPLGEGGALAALSVGGWAEDEEDMNLTIGGGGMVRPHTFHRPGEDSADEWRALLGRGSRARTRGSRAMGYGDTKPLRTWPRRAAGRVGSCRQRRCARPR